MNDTKRDRLVCHTTAWHATQCACGHVELRLGTTRMVFTPAEFSQLHRLMDEAMRAFGIEPSDTDVSHAHPTTH